MITVHTTKLELKNEHFLMSIILNIREILFLTDIGNFADISRYPLCVVTEYVALHIMVQSPNIKVHLHITFFIKC